MHRKLGIRDELISCGTRPFNLIGVALSELAVLKGEVPLHTVKQAGCQMSFS